MSTLLILPNQLYEVKYLKKYDISKILLWECPWYVNNKKYTFNKKKILLHISSMKYYYDYLTRNRYSVTYVNYKTDPKLTSPYMMFDPIDDIKLLKLKKRPSKILESPNFILTLSNYEQHRKKTDKFFFNSFYIFGKKIVNIIPDIKSQDKKNRKTLSKKQLKAINIPSIKKQSKSDLKYINNAITYVNKHFPNNYGNTDNFIYHISHKSAKTFLKDFLDKKFKLFGDYQDFINKDDEYMFHSVLSASINIGLVNPIDIINIVRRYKTKIPLNSYEGYIRQLFWREYQRYTYKYFYCVGRNKYLNYFDNSGRLGKQWYTGTTGIMPIDNSIKHGFSTGYLHHINRLMVIGAYMNMSGISPQQGFKWFMEFSCDSYDWVMCQNVYGMAFFSDGGVTMRRPYASSSNYIIKMSNYPKDGVWEIKWDNLYKAFIKRNRKKLFKYRYYFKLK